MTTTEPLTEREQQALEQMHEATPDDLPPGRFGEERLFRTANPL